MMMAMIAAFSALRMPRPIQGILKAPCLTNDGQPAPMVSVQIKNKNRGAVTDVKGEFSIRRLQPGSYTLQVSLLGFETTEQTVEVSANSTAEIAISLKLSNTQLEEVTIKGTQLKGKRESDYIARLPIRNLENPQVYNTVGQELDEGTGDLHLR